MKRFYVFRRVRKRCTAPCIHVFEFSRFLLPACRATCWKRASALRDFRKPIRVVFIRVFFFGRFDRRAFRYANEYVFRSTTDSERGNTQQVLAVLISVVRRDKSYGRPVQEALYRAFVIAF